MRRSNRQAAVRVAEWIGRILLVAVVGLWWGGHVGPQLFSLAFPSLLPSDNLLRPLDPELDEGFANAASAATLLIVALLAAANTAVGWRRGSGRVAVGGWFLLAALVAVVAVSELSDTHNDVQADVLRNVFGVEGRPADWARIALMSPLLAAFALAMWLFVRRGLGASPARVPIVLGAAAWLLSVAYDATQHILLTGQDHVLGSIIEEMLEICGALLIGLGAAMSLRADAALRTRSHARYVRWRAQLIGSFVAVVGLGALAVVFTYRVLLIDVGATPDLHALDLRLYAQETVAQELRMPANAIGRIDLRLAQRDPDGGTGTAAVRIASPEHPERTLAVGSVEIPSGVRTHWRSIDLLPPLTEPEGRRLRVTVIADIDSNAELWVGVAKSNWYADGGFWINGEPAAPHQDLEFVAYGAAEPTRSKVRAIWESFTSGWRWPATLARVVVGLTLITFFPVVLVTAAWRRPGVSGDRRH
ncbi:MAG: hypothetical protein OXG79_11575 [Chloroflexi bacterium]|nr:hypothetical protein [Chloroflexota bacterium]